VADDVVTEIPAMIDQGGIHRIQVQPLPKKIMLEVIHPRVLAMEWQLETYLSGDRGMWLDGLLMVSHFQSSAQTVSYRQAKDYLDEMFAQPYNRDLAEHFQERAPEWSHVLGAPDGQG
jgi:alpha-galactosidase